MKHLTEDVLIAYQLNESADAVAIAAHLEVCPECARLAECIADTLRVFTAEPVPQTNLDHAWQRLRGSLPPLSPPPRHRSSWSWLLLPIASGAFLIAFFILHHQPAPTHSGSIANVSQSPPSLQPHDPDLAAHLDSAERLLTEVSHSSGPFDETTRSQAHDLLVSNALYVRKANDDGNAVDAAVLDKLGRTLIALEHEPAPEKTTNGWNLRFELNSEGLLLDLRILQQNGGATAKESQ